MLAILLVSLVEWVQVIPPKEDTDFPPGVRVLCVAGYPANVKVCSEILRGAGMWK